jgi:hypothetical protein
MSEQENDRPIPDCVVLNGHVLSPWVIRAEMALREAGVAVIADHLRTGHPLVLWLDGKVVHMPAEEWIARLSGGKPAAG